MAKDQNLPPGQYRYVHELINISAPLSQESAPDPDELTEIAGADLAKSTGNDKAAEFLRRQARRRDKHEQTTGMQVAEDRSNAGLLQHAEGEKASRLRRENNQLKAENRRLRRELYLSAALAVLTAGIMAGSLMGAPTWTMISACVGWVAICIEGVRWVSDTSVSASRFLLAIGAAVAWTVLAGTLGIVFSQSAAPHPTRGHAPVRSPLGSSPPVPGSVQAAADSARGASSDGALLQWSKGGNCRVMLSTLHLRSSALDRIGPRPDEPCQVVTDD